MTDIIALNLFVDKEGEIRAGDQEKCYAY